MSDEDPLVDGQPLSSLRVVDLKEVLDKHGLSKAGNKKELADRLKEYLLNGTREEGSPTKEKTPATSARSSPVKSPENPLVAQYKAKQQAALKEAAIEKERVRKASESSEQRLEGGADDVKEKEVQKEAPEAEEVEEEKPDAEKVKEEKAPVAEEKEASPVPEKAEADTKNDDVEEEAAEIKAEEKVAEEQPENAAEEEENAATEDSSNDNVSSTDASEKHEDTTEAESPAAKEASSSPSPKKSQEVPKSDEPKQDDSADNVDGVELDYGEAETEMEEFIIEDEPKAEEKKDKVMEDESAVKRKRRISIEAPKGDEQVEAKKSRQISPSRYPKSDILHIRGLMRPFTIPLLKAEICKCGGEILDFWIDNIRSHCFAKMGSAEEAAAVRDALHGINWPTSNPKTLAVQFDNEENMERHKSGNAVPAAAATTSASVSRTVSMDSQAEKKEKERRERPTLAPLPGRNGSLKVTVEAMVRDNIRRDEEARERHEKEGKERARELEKRIKLREEKEKEEMENRRKRERSETPPHSRAILEDRKRERKDSGDKKREDRVRKESEVEKKEEKPVKTADEFFKKTKAQPAIYYLPLSEEEATARQAKKARDRR